jgi:hypothetical protein
MKRQIKFDTEDPRLLEWYDGLAHGVKGREIERLLLEAIAGRSTDPRALVKEALREVLAEELPGLLARHLAHLRLQGAEQPEDEDREAAQKLRSMFEDF